MKRYLPIAVLCLIIMAFISCEKEENNDSSITEIINIAGVHVEKNMLVFDDSSSYDSLVSILACYSDAERKQWEDELSFKSQRDIILEIISAENEFDSINYCIYKDATGVDLDSLSEQHSELYNSYLNKGIIKVVDEGTDNEYWDIALVNKAYMDIVNEEGMYAIGSTIYQVTDKYLKTYKEANFNNLDILKNAIETDIYNEIVVTNESCSYKSTSSSYPNGKGPGLKESEWITSGKKRIKLGIYLEGKAFVYSSTNPKWQLYHDAYVQCQEKNWLGNWKYVTTEIWVEGEWGFHLFENPRHLSSSISLNGNGSYLKASINPATGATAPYQSYFIISCTEPSEYNDDISYPPTYDYYYWKATRNGGSSGLNAILEN